MHTLYGRVDNSTAIFVARSSVLAARDPYWNGSYRLRYDVHFTATDVLLKDAVVFAYDESPTAAASTGVDWEAAEVVGTHEKE